MWCSALWNVAALPFKFKPSFLHLQAFWNWSMASLPQKVFSLLTLGKNISVNRKRWWCYQSLWAQLLISSALLTLPLAQRFHFLCLYGVRQDGFDSKPQRHMAESFLLLKTACTGSPVQGSSSSNNNQGAGKIIQILLSSESELLKKKANSLEWIYLILKIKKKKKDIHLANTHYLFCFYD